mmetsp:Transcript_61995/g.147871  ORF Transcript_61995/g.147871 Transcript_61995/m.147871 type:complete len:107 (+) Transcript_61995:715-1035(+)
MLRSESQLPKSAPLPLLPLFQEETCKTLDGVHRGSDKSTTQHPLLNVSDWVLSLSGGLWHSCACTALQTCTLSTSPRLPPPRSSSSPRPLLALVVLACMLVFGAPF